MSRGRVGNHLASSRQGVHADFILGVDANQLVGAKLKEPRGRLPRELENHRNPSLPKDVDLPASKLGITGADCYEGLYGIVCNSTNLRIYTASCELRTAVSVGKKRMPGMPRTYIVQEEQVRGQALRQVLLDTSLLSSQELSHLR